MIAKSEVLILQDHYFGTHDVFAQYQYCTVLYIRQMMMEFPICSVVLGNILSDFVKSTFLMLGDAPLKNRLIIVQSFGKFAV